eukprot:m.39914 g.39914  ORF g.39914 m.39914 type:complete len:77 (-) comp14051_c0_seq2:191-421(-)
MLDLKQEIQQALPDVEVEGERGRSTSFEITVDGKLLFSKLETGAFPDMFSVIKALQQYCANGQLKEVQPDKGCSLM